MNLLNNITTFKGERSRAVSPENPTGEKEEHAWKTVHSDRREKEEEVSVFQWEKRRSLQI